MRSLHPWLIFPTNLSHPLARSLSLQFILDGTICSFELLLHLENFTWENLKGMQIKTEIHCLTKELSKLLLFSLENPLSQKPSLLDKLSYYSEILLQTAEVSAVEIPNLLEEMRNLILNQKLKMHVWKKRSIIPLTEVRNCYLTLYEGLREKFHQFFQALIPYIREARFDENVLSFLIEQKEKFNHYLGERTIENLLLSLFPNGRDELRAVVCEGYIHRGFDSFFARIEPLIEALEWESVHSS
jgi:hypothetical protein